MADILQLTDQQLAAGIRKYTRAYKAANKTPRAREILMAFLLEKERRQLVQLTETELGAAITRYERSVEQGHQKARGVVKRLREERVRRRRASDGLGSQDGRRSSASRMPERTSDSATTPEQASGGPGPTSATATRKTEPAAGSSYGWTTGQTIAFVLFMLFGLPLMRTVCDSPGKRSRLPPNVSSSARQRSNAARDDSARRSTKAFEPSSRPRLPRTARSAVALLPQDGIYSQPAGTGGSYRDAMNRYFEAQPPAGWEIVERRDKSTFTFGPDSTQPGRIVPRSWVVFGKNGAQIGVIARQSFSSIERDFDLVVKGFRQRAGATVEQSRFVTIDGSEGGELVGSVQGMRILVVKYKKNGIDHAITMTCPAGEVGKCFPVFDQFVRSYRSLKAATQHTRP